MWSMSKSSVVVSKVLNPLAERSSSTRTPSPDSAVAPNTNRGALKCLSETDGLLRLAKARRVGRTSLHGRPVFFMVKTICFAHYL